MAQIKLHGNKALIIQGFNSMPNIVIMEFVGKRKERYCERILANNGFEVR